MAVVLPMVAMYASGAAIAAGTATFATYVAFAGAAMSTIGTISGDKNLKKWGGYLSLAGGVAGLAGGFTSAADAASSAADASSVADASSAWDAAGSAAGSDLAQFGKYAQEASGAVDAGAMTTAGELAASGSELAGSSLDIPTQGLQLEGAAELGAKAIEAPSVSTSSLSAVQQPESSSIFDRIMGAEGAGAEATGKMAEAAVKDPYAIQSSSVAKPQSISEMLKQSGGSEAMQVAQRPNALAQQASQLSLDDVMGSIKRTGAGAMEWMQKNPELAKFGFQALQSTFGPEAEMADMQDSIMRRRLANMNSPIRLTRLGG